MECSTLLSLNSNLLCIVFEFMKSSQIRELRRNCMNTKILYLILRRGKIEFQGDPNKLVSHKVLTQDFIHEKWFPFFIKLFQDKKGRDLLVYFSRTKSFCFTDMVTFEIFPSLKLLEEIDCLDHIYDKFQGIDFIFYTVSTSTIFRFNIEDSMNQTMIKQFDCNKIEQIKTFYHKFHDKNYLIVNFGDEFSSPKHILDLNGNLIREFGENEDSCIIELCLNRCKNGYLLIDLNDNNLDVYDFDSGNLLQRFASKIWKYGCILYKEDNLIYLNNNKTISKLQIDGKEIRLIVESENKDTYCCYFRAILKWNRNYFIAGRTNRFEIYDKQLRITNHVITRKSEIVHLLKYIHPVLGEILVVADYDGIITIYKFD